LIVDSGDWLPRVLWLEEDFLEAPDANSVPLVPGEVVHQQRWETVEFWAMISETETTLISFPLSMSAVGNFDVNFALVMEQLMARQAVAFVA
jgi:hypothetical protein